MAFTVFVPPPTPGPLERDFEAYYAAGATVNAGGDPYSRAIWAAEARVPGVTATRDELLPYVGPAAALPVWSALARLPYAGAVAVWTAVLVGAFLTLVGGALSLAGRRRGLPAYLGTGALTFAAAPMLSAFALGQAAIVAAAGVAAALVAFRARRLPAALLATLVSAVQPNLAFALLGRLRTRWDAAVVLAAAAAFSFITLGTGGGVRGLIAYQHRLAAHGSAERFITIQHTPAAIAHAFGAAPGVAIVIGTVAALGAIAATALVIVRERLDATSATLLCCTALPLAVPFFHEHDFVLEILPVLVLALRAHGRPRALAAVAASLVLVDWFGFAQRHVAQAQILSLGFAVAFGFIALAPTRARGYRGFAGLVTLVVLGAIAVPLGITHPSPTWPDDLPPAFHANPADDASRVWGSEQRASGLERVDPAWGALRSLPLAGCVVLGIALVGDARARRRARAAAIPRTGRMPAVAAPLRA